MRVPDLAELVDLAWNAFDDVTSPPRVQPSVPILFFGDLKAYCASPLRVLTVGLNPSDKEFPESEPFKRFPSLKDNSQDRDPVRYLDAMSAYFKTEPYSSWFKSFDPLFKGLSSNGLGSACYENGEDNAASRVLHTDICSPVATQPTWSRLDKVSRELLEKKGIPLWHRLLEKLKPQIVVLSVAQKYLKHIQFEPFTDWETIHTFTERSKITPCPRPYPVCRRWYSVGGERSMFAFGQAAQKPFGLITKPQKWEAGERLKKRYLEEDDKP